MQFPCRECWRAAQYRTYMSFFVLLKKLLCPGRFSISGVLLWTVLSCPPCACLMKDSRGPCLFIYYLFKICEAAMARSLLVLTRSADFVWYHTHLPSISLSSYVSQAHKNTVKISPSSRGTIPHLTELHKAGTLDTYYHIIRVQFHLYLSKQYTDSDTCL